MLLDIKTINVHDDAPTVETNSTLPSSTDEEAESVATTTTVVPTGTRRQRWIHVNASIEYPSECPTDMLKAGMTSEEWYAFWNNMLMRQQSYVKESFYRVVGSFLFMVLLVVTLSISTPVLSDSRLEFMWFSLVMTVAVLTAIVPCVIYLRDLFSYPSVQDLYHEYGHELFEAYGYSISCGSILMHDSKNDTFMYERRVIFELIDCTEAAPPPPPPYYILSDVYHYGMPRIPEGMTLATNATSAFPMENWESFWNQVKSIVSSTQYPATYFENLQSYCGNANALYFQPCGYTVECDLRHVVLWGLKCMIVIRTAPIQSLVVQTTTSCDNDLLAVASVRICV